MTADIELLPLPEHTEAGEFTFDAHVFEHTDMVSYARANVAHATAAKDAEIEALREENERWRILCNGESARRMDAEDRAERLAEALRLIAAPKRQDGTWNRDREACRQIAAEALRDHDQEEGSGAFWGSSPKSGGPDWTGFDG